MKYKKESLLEQLGGAEAEHRDLNCDLPDTVLPSCSTSSSTSPSIPDLPTTQLGSSSEEIQNAAKFDLDFLAALIMPTIFIYFFPPVFISVWNWLLSFVHQARTFPQLALGLPRGFGKTTLMKIFIIYCILFTKRRFILIISATTGFA